MEVFIMNKLIDVLVVKPGEHPVIEKIMNNFDAIREFIGGVIDTLTLEEFFDDGGNSNEIFIVFNDEGKLKKLKSNRHITKDIIIAGTFVICCVNINGDLVSLQADKIKIIMIDFLKQKKFQMMMYKQILDLRIVAGNKHYIKVIVN